MSKCTQSCTIMSDKRTGEPYCFNHGTVTFVRQAHDAAESYYDKNPYTDSFIYNAFTRGTLKYNVDAIAKELGLEPVLVSRAITKHRHRVLKNIA